MTPSRLKDLSIRAATSQHGLTQGEAMELVAEVKALRASMRKCAIAEFEKISGWHMVCILCDSEWRRGTAERHQPDCFAAPGAT